MHIVLKHLPPPPYSVIKYSDLYSYEYKGLCGVKYLFITSPLPPKCILGLTCTTRDSYILDYKPVPVLSQVCFSFEGH